MQVIREIRILDDSVRRSFYYVKANVNPATYVVLKGMETQIADEDIRTFLADATFVSEEDGYEWHVYGQPALSPRGANRVAANLAEVIVRMHRLVMDTMGLEPSKTGELRSALPSRKAQGDADAEPTP